jgi:hypothetical protein
MEEEHGRGKLFISWQPGSKEEYRPADKVHLSRAHSLVTYFLQACPTSYFLPCHHIMNLSWNYSTD